MIAIWIARRAAAGLAMMAALCIITFSLVALAPGDLASEAEADPRLSPATVAKIRESFGLHKPFPQRLAAWGGRLLRGDLGDSLAYHTPVAGLLIDRLGNTLILALPSMMLAWLLSFGAAVSAGLRGSLRSRLQDGAAAVIVSIPEPVAAAVLVLSAVWTGWFPTGGMHDPRSAPAVADLLHHALLPALTLALWAGAPLYFHVRSALAESSSLPFLESAAARGITGIRLTVSYTLLAAAPRMIPLLGLSAGSMLSGSLVAESIFAWPGLGALLLDAVAARDIPVVLGAILVSAAFRLMANLAADLALLAADPRIRPT